jgi:hypothetical protein
MGVGAGAAAVLSVLGVLVFSPGDSTPGPTGQPLALPGPVEVPSLPSSALKVVPSLPQMPIGDFAGLVSLDGIVGGSAPILPPDPKPEARTGPAANVRSNAVPKAEAKRPAAPHAGSPGVATPPAASTQKPAPPAQSQPVQRQPEPSYPAYPSQPGYGGYPYYPYWGYGYRGGPC